MSLSKDTAKLVTRDGERQNIMRNILQDFLFKLDDRTGLMKEVLGQFERHYESMQAEIDYLNECLDRAEQELSDLSIENRRLKRISIRELDYTIDLLHKRRRTLCPYDQDIGSPIRSKK
jgi:chromosome segregation ATPase